MPATMPAGLKTRKFAAVDPAAFRMALLGWYDRHARGLPWRVAPGKGAKQADPYHVWLSEVMLQQTTVQAVIPYFVKFVDKWSNIHNLSAAADEEVMREWAGLGYYARARNLLKCARVVSSELGGVFPQTLDGLKALPGIGDYTAAAILSIAFDRVATVIDGNVDRVVSRIFAIDDPLPDSKPEIREKARILFEGANATRPGDFAQAMMDLGATICTPKTPKCTLCPVARQCQALAKGLAADLPRRKEKAIRPKRFGYIYWITNPQGQVLFEKRPERGLLGGMAAFPTSDWVAVTKGGPPAIDHISAMKDVDNMDMNKGLRVRHVFTHFELELQGVAIAVPESFKPRPDQYWVAPAHLHGQGLPTVFRKFLHLVAGGGTKR